MTMTVQQATAEVFLTAFKALPRREQEHILGRRAHDRRLRRVLEEVSDRLGIEKERGGTVSAASWLYGRAGAQGAGWVHGDADPLPHSRPPAPVVPFLCPRFPPSPPGRPVPPAPPGRRPCGLWPARSVNRPAWQAIAYLWSELLGHAEPPFHEPIRIGAFVPKPETGKAPQENQDVTHYMVSGTLF